MKNNIMVTVVMLCYNHEPYMRQALDSVVNQVTDFPIEVIVHDDASTDHSAAIIREYEKKYPDIIRPIYQTENQYSKDVEIRRVFIDPMIRGKYVASCECDDYWLDMNKLQKQVDFLEAHPEYSGTAHNCVIVDQNSQPLDHPTYIYRPYRSHRYTLKRLALDAAYPGQTATLVCRHSAYCWNDHEVEAGFYNMRLLTGDKRMFLHLLLTADIYCFEEKMSAHRVVTQGGDSWTARTHGRNLSFYQHIAEIDFRQFVKKYYKRDYPNQYTIFHTGVACVGKYFMNPTQENKEVFHRAVAEHGGILKLCLYLLGMGIVSIPKYFARKKEIIRYDP